MRSGCRCRLWVSAQDTAAGSVAPGRAVLASVCQWSCLGTACRGLSGPRMLSLRVGWESLTCGIAGTPDRGHLSCRSLLPDHSAKVVLVTDLVGFCQGPEAVGAGGRGEGGRERAAGSRRARPLRNICRPGLFPAKRSPKPTQSPGCPSPRAPPQGRRTLTRAPLGTALPVLILRALARCSPEERTGAEALPSLCAAPTRHAAAAPRCPGLPLPIHCGARPGMRAHRWRRGGDRSGSHGEPGVQQQEAMRRREMETEGAEPELSLAQRNTSASRVPVPTATPVSHGPPQPRGSRPSGPPPAGPGAGP